jgi:hypothetical protein
MTRSNPSPNDIESKNIYMESNILKLNKIKITKLYDQLYLSNEFYKKIIFFVTHIRQNNLNH